ncbi:hypothetical protein RM844_04620 [Streptomyces sp. DSM 44915]|uniref:Small CPxCG-related zinc finger protein n=1 Tax=Streptomyces chisholmiae TaxID=3075540 RepID=A0ABU2JKR4_9ACTN|nr:hypothetical protein [Streptomyces sp. DSM 44915]MDT0265572.1 hypothetical protein [Streptomyces sp. DSM 44915]
MNAADRYCHWCDATTEELELIDIIGGETGAGWGLHACPPCVQREELVPLNQRPASASTSLSGTPEGRR